MTRVDDQKEFPNLYASPSILITSRSQTAPDLIRAISPDRLLVESDSCDVRHTTKLVWAATKWIAGCRGWKVEDGETEWRPGTDRPIAIPMPEGEVWEPWATGQMGAVRSLELNMFRFLGLEDRGP